MVGRRGQWLRRGGWSPGCVERGCLDQSELLRAAVFPRPRVLGESYRFALPLFFPFVRPLLTRGGLFDAPVRESRLHCDHSSRVAFFLFKKLSL